MKFQHPVREDVWVEVRWPLLARDIEAWDRAARAEGKNLRREGPMSLRYDPTPIEGRLDRLRGAIASGIVTAISPQVTADGVADLDAGIANWLSSQLDEGVYLRTFEVPLA